MNLKFDFMMFPEKCSAYVFRHIHEEIACTFLEIEKLKYVIITVRIIVALILPA